MRFIIPLQSFSNIITNSSSELFVTSLQDTDYTAKIVENILEEIYNTDRKKREELYKKYGYDYYIKICSEECIDSSSGDGGELEIKTINWEDVVRYIRKCDRYKYDKKGKFLHIIIDHNRHHSIKWIKNNLPIITQSDC